jgi:hypothetical protein
MLKTKLIAVTLLSVVLAGPAFAQYEGTTAPGVPTAVPLPPPEGIGTNLTDGKPIKVLKSDDATSSTGQSAAPALPSVLAPPPPLPPAELPVPTILPNSADNPN